MAKSRRRKKLTIAQIEKRENYKWGIMFFAQSHIVIQKETKALLKEELILASNEVEKLKRSDQLSKRARKIGLVDSVPEIITIKVNKEND